jgi:hypothetical protein
MTLQRLFWRKPMPRTPRKPPERRLQPGLAAPLFWILLLAASSSVPLVDQTFQIPANDWRFVDLGLRQRSALVRANFNVESGPPVQLLLMEQADMERLNRGDAHGVVMATPVGATGRLAVHPSKPGDYVVVIENRSGQAETSKVRLRVSVDFVESTQLSPERQLVVITISFAVFFGIVTYSARRLWHAVRR